MSEKDEKGFRVECRKFLDSFILHDLTPYAREIGVKNPTNRKKDYVIDQIIGVLLHEIPPVEPSTRGAPVKNDEVNPKIEEGIRRLRALHLHEETTETGEEFQFPESDMPVYDFTAELKKMQEKGKIRWTLADPNAEELEGGLPEIRVGQLATINSVSLLLPLDCIDSEEKMIISPEFIRQFALREGDVVSCYVRKSGGVLIAARLVSVNGQPMDKLKRIAFEEGEACYPTDPIHVFDETRYCGVANKFTQWLIPFKKGQRGLVLSSPKCGKTQYLQTIAEAAAALNKGLETLVLLVDQAPETVNAFRKVLPQDSLVYTTYEDDPDRQVFAAEFLLNRAKRLVESGKDVLLVLDSFNALARAFNDTDESAGGKMLACGLESKTVHFLKKYFGAARCLEKRGSLTILGGVSLSTGNPADDFIVSELASLANLEIRLCDRLASRRVYPALDLDKVHARESGALDGETGLNDLVRGRFLQKHSAEELLLILSKSASYKDFRLKIEGASK